MKLINEKIEGCRTCPFSYQDKEGVYCSKIEPIEVLLSCEEFYTGITIKNKYGQLFPPFCPLPDVED